MGKGLGCLREEERTVEAELDAGFLGDRREDLEVFFFRRFGEGDGRTNGKRLTGKFEFGEAEESEAVKDGAQW